MRHLKVDKETIELLYIVENKTIKEISRELNIAQGSVFNLMRDYGIKSRLPGKAKGWKHTEESLRKMSAAQKGKKMSEEAKRKMSEAKKVGGIGHKKLRDDGYISIYFPDHPRSSKDGYILEHVLVMECLIGRHLNPDEVVHHKNEIKTDNRKENLELMTKSEHMRYHTTQRQKNGGIPHHTVKVINIDTNEVFPSCRAAAEKYGVKSSNISRACKSSRRKIKGNTFRYYEEEKA